uniref:F-box protein At3g07870-like n=1 Tax=Fragaria vesca subsp. vesca TaxID=101020 RepID=UPI0005C84D5E|nr:PREDICTED: F-box protein At3g07870-like [Fragaria vesca subsp. vesca]
MGTGVWRSIGIVPKCGSILKAPFDAILHGALHWVSFWGKSSKFIHSFDFEREEFQRIPPPGNFGLIEKQYTDSLKLGVLGDCLILSVFSDDSSRFDMWVMKDYGIQESWTRSLVIENFFPKELSFVCCEPIILLSNGEILMFNDDDPWVIVCYNKEEKSFREARITSTTLPLIQLGYCPSFVSLHDVSKGEVVKRYYNSTSKII